MRMNGALNKQFFRGGEGNMLVEGSVRDLAMRFQPGWPVIGRADLEIVLDDVSFDVYEAQVNALVGEIVCLIELAPVEARYDDEGADHHRQLRLRERFTRYTCPPEHVARLADRRQRQSKN